MPSFLCEGHKKRTRALYNIFIIKREVKRMQYEIKKGKEFRQSIVTINEYDDDNYCDIFATKLKFTDEVAPKGIELTDLSNDGDGSVVGWIDGDTYKVSTQEKGQKVIFNEDCKSMFGMFEHEDFGEIQRIFKEIDFAMIDTSNVKDMSEMFHNCFDLKELNLSGFNTSKVEDMSRMFDRCRKLKELDLSNFDTSQVKYMNEMFDCCGNLRELDLSHFNTSNVEDMNRMFAWCERLTNLDLSNFDTSNVKNMMGMFLACEKMQKLNLSSFDTSKVTDMGNLFWRCYGLESLDLSSFDTSQVKYMNGMFSSCFYLKELDLIHFDTSNVKDMSEMFAWCGNLKDKQLKNIYEEWLENQQNQVHSNINPKNLKISKGKEMQKDKGIDKE